MRQEDKGEFLKGNTRCRNAEAGQSNCRFSTDTVDILFWSAAPQAGVGSV